MAKATKKKSDNFLDDLDDTISKSKSIPVKDSITPIEESQSIQDKEEITSIDSELAKFEKNIKDIEVVLDSINPLAVQDIEERAKVLKLKMDILYKLPPLYAALDNLRTKDKLKTEQIKGNKDISPLEDGSLD